MIQYTFFWLCLDFSSKQTFKIINSLNSGIPSERHTVWIHIGPNKLPDPTWVQTVFKSYHQRTSVATSGEFLQYIPLAVHFLFSTGNQLMTQFFFSLSLVWVFLLQVQTSFSDLQPVIQKKIKSFKYEYLSLNMEFENWNSRSNFLNYHFCL